MSGDQLSRGGEIIQGQINVDIISYFLFHNFNNSLSCATFPTSMKYGEVRPVHKKDDKTDKENYCPISILSNLSKVYERLMYN